MNETQDFIEKAIKIQGQFFELPDNFRDQLIKHAHDKANNMCELVSSGKAKNYDEALHMLPSAFPTYPEMDIKLETIDHGTALVKTEKNGDYYLYLGSNPPQFLGNADEGVYSEISGTLNINTTRQMRIWGKSLPNLNY